MKETFTFEANTVKKETYVPLRTAHICFLFLFFFLFWQTIPKLFLLAVKLSQTDSKLRTNRPYKIASDFFLSFVYGRDLPEYSLSSRRGCVEIVQVWSEIFHKAFSSGNHTVYSTVEIVLVCSKIYTNSIPEMAC